MKKTMFDLAAIGVALLTTAASVHADYAATHETVAVLTEVKELICHGRTSDCPWECGGSGDKATFTVKKYLNYKLVGKADDLAVAGKQEKFFLQVTAYKGENNKQPSCNPKIQNVMTGLKTGDYVLLSWNHTYDGQPRDGVLKLEKLEKEQAEKLLVESNPEKKP